MSELQIALIAIGALIIVAVLIINWWQERRFHRQLESNFSPLNKDALLDESPLESADFQAAIDPHATDHFSINSEVLGDSIAEPSIQTTINAQGAAEDYSHDEAFQEEMPIEDAPEASIELSPPYASESADIDTDVEISNVVPPNDFKETLAEAINANTLKASQDPIETAFETAVSLPLMLQGQMDLTALLYLATATPAGTINNALGTLFNGFDKPIFVHVQDANKQWHLLDELTSNPEALNRQIARVACSIQLADRGGAISRGTLNRFQLTVENFNLAINGNIEWQGKGDAFANANTLDEFCIEVDKTIGFHLAHGENGPFTGTKLRGLAEAQGLVLGAEGHFKCIDDADTMQTNPSFVMFNRDDYSFSPDMLRNSVVKGITFQLDIPHVKKCAEAFNHMVQVARQMETGLNAVLVDDNNKVLGDMQIEKIRQQLKVIQATMLMRGIVPGSDSARRLFS